MALANMAVFNSFMHSSATETIGQQVELFNVATNGAITLRSGTNEGDFDFDTMFKQISGLVGNRNAYGAGALTPVDLEQLQNASVKIGGQTKVVRFEPQQFDWIDANPEEAGTAFGVQVAKGMMEYMLNSAIGAASSAVSGVAALLHDGTAGVASLISLNKGASKFGDRSSDISAWVMHSKSLHDIYEGSLTNTARLFEFGNVKVMDDGFGRPLIMTDSPNLLLVDGGGVGTDWYYQLGVVSGGILLEDNQKYRAYDDQKIDVENVQHTMKAEFDFNLGLKGYTWDTAAGGKSPNDAAIKTQTNWDQTATDTKDTALVRVTTL